MNENFGRRRNIRIGEENRNRNKKVIEETHWISKERTHSASGKSFILIDRDPLKHPETIIFILRSKNLTPFHSSLQRHATLRNRPSTTGTKANARGQKEIRITSFESTNPLASDRPRRLQFRARVSLVRYRHRTTRVFVCDERVYVEASLNFCS